MTPEASRTRPQAGQEALLLRDASVEDARTIEAVHYASREAAYRDRVAEWPPEGPNRTERIARWREWLSNPDVSCIVAERRGEIVGFITVRSSVDVDTDPLSVAEMPTLYVRPDRWRSGVGRALCVAGLARATARGFTELTLWVLDVNTRATGFYEALGFEPDGATMIDPATSDRLVVRRYRLKLEERAG